MGIIQKYKQCGVPTPLVSSDQRLSADVLLHRNDQLDLVHPDRLHLDRKLRGPSENPAQLGLHPDPKTKDGPDGYRSSVLRDRVALGDERGHPATAKDDPHSQREDDNGGHLGSRLAGQLYDEREC